MTIVVLGIDLGKNSCNVAGLDEEGRVVLRKRLGRGFLESFVGRLEICVMAMEACCGAHHLARVFSRQGHDVRLMSPEYVHPITGRRGVVLCSAGTAHYRFRYSKSFIGYFERILA